MTDDLPTARSTHKTNWVVLFVWCKACHQSDRPLKDLKFRCAQRGSRHTDAAMMGKGGVGVQPWRRQGPE